jgi:hypothetical protein
MRIEATALPGESLYLNVDAKYGAVWVTLIWVGESHVVEGSIPARVDLVSVPVRWSHIHLLRPLLKRSCMACMCGTFSSVELSVSVFMHV